MSDFTCQMCAFYVRPLHAGDISCAVNPSCRQPADCFDFEIIRDGEVKILVQETELMPTLLVDQQRQLIAAAIQFVRLNNLYIKGQTSIPEEWGFPPLHPEEEAHILEGMEMGLI